MWSNGVRRAPPPVADDRPVWSGRTRPFTFLDGVLHERELQSGAGEGCSGAGGRGPIARGRMGADGEGESGGDAMRMGKPAFKIRPRWSWFNETGEDGDDLNIGMIGMLGFNRCWGGLCGFQTIKTGFR